MAFFLLTYKLWSESIRATLMAISYQAFKIPERDGLKVCECANDEIGTRWLPV